MPTQWCSLSPQATLPHNRINRPLRPLAFLSNPEPLLFQARLLRLDAAQLPAKLDQPGVVARVRGEQVGELFLPGGEPLDLTFQPLKLLTRGTLPARGTRRLASHGSRFTFRASPGP